MSPLLHIFKFKLLTFIKIQGELNIKSILKQLSASVVYILFAIGIFFFTRNVITYLMDDVRIGMFLLHRFVFVVLFIFFMTVNIGNIVVSYSTFFKSSEAGFLLTMPISFAKIFLIKFLDNFFYSSSTLLLMVTAALAGYTSYFGLPWYFIPFAVLFLILPFMFIAGTLGAITLLVIMRFASTFGIKKVLVTIASVYGTTIILFYIFSSPVQLVTRVFAYFPNINNYFGFLESPAVKLLPNHWVADALYWISSGKYIAAGWHVYLLIVVSILFFLFALFLAKKWFYKTWLVFLNLSSELSVKKKNNGKVLFSFENRSSLKPRREALLKREFLLFIREPSQWTHFLVMTFLITIFIVSISNIDVMILNAYNIYLKTLVYLVIYLFNVFLIASMSLRFIFPLVSLEGETIWKIRSAPLNYKKLMLTRLFIYSSVIFVIGQILNFVSNYQFSITLTLISQLNTAFVTITLVSLNFGMGAAYANYKEKNPIRVASSQGASLTFLFTIIYLVFLIVLLFAPLINYFYEMDTRNFSSVSQLLYTTAILGTIAFIMSYLSISKGVRHFIKDI
jgi:ABC-2 type transport system permease protein